MGLKSQEKNSILALVEWKMKLKGILGQKELSKLTGIPPSNLSRFFKGKGLAFKHVYSLLNKLDLLNTPDFHSREIHNLYKELASERKYIQNLLIENQKFREIIADPSLNKSRHK